MKTGKAHRNVRSPNRRCETCYMMLKNLKVYPFLTLVVWACRVIGAPIVMARGASVHRCPPPPIGNADQAQCANKIFFVFGLPLLLAQVCIGAPIYWRIISKMIVLGAPRLFSYQSPINCALQTGNGNTLRRRRRQY